MKPLLFLCFGVLSAVTALADDKPSFTISARFENFNPTYLADATRPTGRRGLLIRQE